MNPTKDPATKLLLQRQLRDRDVDHSDLQARWEQFVDKHKLTFTVYSVVYDPGWIRLLDALFTKLYAIGWVNSPVGQIKEKFGTLRIYMDGQEGTSYERMFELIDECERKASESCYLCGEPGTPRTEGRMHRLCDRCYTPDTAASL